MQLSHATPHTLTQPLSHRSADPQSQRKSIRKHTIITEKSVDWRIFKYSHYQFRHGALRPAQPPSFGVPLRLPTRPKAGFCSKYYEDCAPWLNHFLSIGTALSIASFCGGSSDGRKSTVAPPFYRPRPPLSTASRTCTTKWQCTRRCPAQTEGSITAAAAWTGPHPSSPCAAPWARGDDS